MTNPSTAAVSPHPKPTSILVVRPDPSQPLAVYAVWFGSRGDYTLDWGDGTSSAMLWWWPPKRHVYGEAGSYRISGHNEETGEDKTHWVTVPPTPPSPSRPAPVVEVRRQRDEFSSIVRLLFSPRDEEGFDHRQVAHDIDWDDGSAQHVPAGTAYVDHQYPKAPHNPGDVKVPVITVTDSQERKTTRIAADPWLSVRIDYLPWWKSFQGWSPFIARLPSTQGPHEIWVDGDLRYRGPADYPENNNHYIGKSIDNYPVGYSATTVVASDGQIACMPTYTIQGTVPNQAWEMPWGMAMYDFEPGDPWLITVKAGCYARGCCGPATSMRVEWGDNTGEVVAGIGAGEDDELVTQRRHQIADQAGEDVPSPQGPHPLASHWYTPGPGRTYTLKIKAEGGYTVGWSQIQLGPTGVSSHPVVGKPLARELRFTVPDDATPVRVDWGDGTPVVVRYPRGGGGDTGSLTHTYDMAGTYRVTVHAPLQDPVHFTVTVGGREPYSIGLTAWFGDVLEWDGGYSGHFHVTNHTDSPAAWAVEFDLEDPALLWDVWPTPSAFRRLADGRWRITCPTPLAPGGSAVVGARVEPVGKTRRWPEAIVAKPWTPNPEPEGA